MEPIDTHKLTWAALIGQWMTFAQSAVALPDNDEGNAWKSAVPSVITLQAIYFALKEVHTLPLDEQAVAYDRSAVQLDEHTDKLHSLFNEQTFPQKLEELITDVQSEMNTLEFRLNTSK